MKPKVLGALFAILIVALPSAQSEKLDYTMLGRIRDEGVSRSRVMDHISWLSDVSGPRLTASPGLQRASEWAMKKFGEWGLANGTGRVRGIWRQSNLAARSIFEQWMAPLADLGVAAAGPRSVVSTDHVAFDEVGIPGFQFMVDRLEYNARTHHSNMDSVDRVQRDDMVQHATVAAVFAYHAAMRDEKLPRKAPPAPRRQPGTGQ